MSTKVTTLLQGEGPDLPDNGDIVFADVEIWKFDPEKPDNHYKGDKILGPKRFTFQVGQVFMGEHEWLSFLYEQVKETFINGRTRLTESHQDNSGYVVEMTLKDIKFKIEQDTDD